MSLQINISLLPILYIPIIYILLGIFAFIVSRKTNIKRELYLSISFIGIALFSILTFKYIGVPDIPFWSNLYQYASICLVFQILATTYFSKQRIKTEVASITLITVLLLFSLLLDVFFAGQVLFVSFLIYGVWQTHQSITKKTKYLLRGVSFILIGFFQFLGQWFPLNSGSFLFSIMLVLAIIVECQFYFMRVLNMLRTASINSITDPLTNLYNRGFIFKKSAQLINNQQISIIFIDLDNFKQLNDNKGHEFGDKVLIQVGALLKRELISKGLGCRYGGEELIGIVTDGDANDIAMRLCKCIEEETDVTISVGVASSEELMDNDVAALIRKADERMYIAKSTGKNKVISSNI